MQTRTASRIDFAWETQDPVIVRERRREAGGAPNMPYAKHVSFLCNGHAVIISQQPSLSAWQQPEA